MASFDMLALFVYISRLYGAESPQWMMVMKVRNLKSH